MVQMESEAEDEAQSDWTSPEAQQDRGKTGTKQGAGKTESATIARLRQKQVAGHASVFCQPARCPSVHTLAPEFLDRLTRRTGCYCCICSADTVVTVDVSYSSSHDKHLYRQMLMKLLKLSCVMLPVT